MRTNIKNKNVLFITTKNLDYIRNTQELTFVKKVANSYTVIGSNSKYYFVRLIVVYFSLIKISTAQFDTAFLGFAPQLVLPLFKHKFRHIYVITDFFVSLFDTLCEDRKLFSPNGLLGNFLHYLDKVTLHKSDYIICDTITHGEFFADEFGIPYSKLHSLYLKADRAIYYPRTVKKFTRLEDKYIVLYFGSILPLQGIEVILQAITMLREENGIFFYVIGPVKEDTKSAFCADTTNVKFINWLSQGELADYISQADLCLAGHFNNNIAKAKRTIPGKACIYEAIGKPMILGDNPANHELFVDDSSHIFVEMGNAHALAEAIHTCACAYFSITIL